MSTKAPYRNALRSKKMIKQAFLQLLCEKDISKIKVLEVTNIADISKGTFYTHFHDVYAVLEEIENECLNGMSEVLNASTSANMLEDLTPFLINFFSALNREKEKYSYLMRSTCVITFLAKMQQRFVDYMMSDADMIAKIKSNEQAHMFFSFLAVGISKIVHEVFNNETNITFAELVKQLNGCIINGISTILK